MSYSFQIIGLSSISFIKFLPRYFILFDVIVNGIVNVLLISLSDSSLLVYRNATDYSVIKKNEISLFATT